MHKEKTLIPEFFFSRDGEPISHCLVCERYLLDDADYVIEKSFNRYPGVNSLDTIYEIAVCMPCLQKLTNEYSEESEQAIQQYFRENMDFTMHLKLTQEEMYDHELFLSKCAVKGTPMESLDHFQVSAQCRGSHLVFGQTPFLLSGAAIDEMTDLLSNETIDFMNGFRDTYLPPPTDLHPLFEERDFVIV